jgi:hypothetical protein
VKLKTNNTFIKRIKKKFKNQKNKELIEILITKRTNMKFSKKKKREKKLRETKSLPLHMASQQENDMVENQTT